MSDGISVTRLGEVITITTTVGDNTARLRVTRQYANKLAARLMVAAADEHEPKLGADGRYVDA